MRQREELLCSIKKILLDSMRPCSQEGRILKVVGSIGERIPPGAP